MMLVYARQRLAKNYLLFIKDSLIFCTSAMHGDSSFFSCALGFFCLEISSLKHQTCLAKYFEGISLFLDVPLLEFSKLFHCS